MIVHLIDGTYELFRHFYGIRRFKKTDPPYGAVSGVLTTVAQLLDALVPAIDRTRLEDDARRRADAALVSARMQDMEPIAWFDSRYPALLNCVADPPPVLWARGSIEALCEPAVAVVGSRAATAYALDVGERLGASWLREAS